MDVKKDKTEKLCDCKKCDKCIRASRAYARELLRSMLRGEKK